MNEKEHDKDAANLGTDHKIIRLKANDGEQAFGPIISDIRTGELGFVSDAPMWSNLSPERAVGKMLRKYPTLAMLPAWKDMVENVGNRAACRTTYIEGPPGIGKTEIGLVLADVMGADATHILCESNKSLSDLLVRQVHEPADKRSELERIEERIAQGKIHRFTALKVQKALSAESLGIEEDAFREEGKGFAIEWDKIPPGKIDDIERMLGEIIASELPKGKGSLLGIQTQDGELMVTLKEALDLDKPEGQRKPKPRVIIFDEFSRRGEDGGSLQNFFEVIGGDPNRECKLTDAAGKEHVINNEMLREAGVYFVFSANLVSEKDPDVKPMPAALARRLKPKTILDYDANDFQNAIERAIFGAPLSMAVEAGKPSGRNLTVESLRDWGTKARTLGLGDKDSPGPDYAESFIHNHENVRQGVRRVAEFFQEWREVEDPNSQFYVARSGISEDPDGLTSLEEMQAQASVMSRKRSELRKAIRAEQSDPRGQRTSLEMGIGMALDIVRKSWSDVIRPDHLPQFVRKEGELPEERFGDFLVHRIQEFLAERYPNGNSPIRQYLEQRMLSLGIAHEEDRLEAIRRMEEVGIKFSDRKPGTVDKMLNSHPPVKASEEALGWRDALVDYLKAKYKGTENEIDEAARPQEVLPDQLLVRLLDNLPGNLKENIVDLAPFAKVLPLLRAESAVDESGVIHRGTDFGQMQAIDSLMIGSHATAGILDSAGENRGSLPGPDAKRVVMTLGLPGAMDAVTDHLFQAGYSSLQGSGHANNTEDLKLLENRSESGLAITTVQTEARDDGDPETLHIIRHSSHGKSTLLVVGESSLGSNSCEDEKLRKRLERAGITYVAQSDSKAREVIESKVEDLVELGTRARTAHGQAEPVDLKEMLFRAFRLRNPPSEALKARVAGELGVPVEDLSQDSSVLKGKSIVDLLVDASLTEPAAPVLLREKAFEHAGNGTHAATVSSEVTTTRQQGRS